MNLSARQFQTPGLELHVAQVPDATGIAPSLLCLEIAECLAMNDVERTSNTHPVRSARAGNAPGH